MSEQDNAAQAEDILLREMTLAVIVAKDANGFPLLAVRASRGAGVVMTIDAKLLNLRSGVAKFTDAMRFISDELDRAELAAEGGLRLHSVEAVREP